MASKGLGWAGGSHVEFGVSSSLPMEPELAPCGWRCPHRRLTLMRLFGNGNGNGIVTTKQTQLLNFGSFSDKVGGT
jgi:hypothetical protein